MNQPPLGDAREALASAVLDSRRKFGVMAQVDLRYSLHLQTWPSGACGYDGMGVASSTVATCVVVEHGDKVRVYHAGRFAYQVDHPSYHFREALRERRLMGAKKFNDGDGIEYMREVS